MEKLRALFLNEDGSDAEKSDIDTTGRNQYFEARDIYIDVARIEYFYECKTPFYGEPTVNIMMYSGEEWTVIISVDDVLKKIAKTRQSIYN